MTPPMKTHGEQDEARDDAELNYQGCFDQIAPKLSFAFGKVGV